MWGVEPQCRGAAWRALAWFAMLALCACTGEIEADEAGESPAGPWRAGDQSGAGSGPGSGPGAMDGPAQVPPGSNPGSVDLSCDDAAQPGVTPLTKLSTREYQNTVRDLLAASGAGELPSNVQAQLDRVPDDSLGDSFRALDNRISLEHVQAYFDVGVAVGDLVTSDAQRLRALAGDCAMAASLDDGCARAFVERFARLAYRRPPSEEEVEQLAALNDGERTPAEAVRAIVIVAMSSPRFVNHLEIDGAELSGSDDLLQLTGYEIASRLSYLFWQTMPDEALLEAAQDGSLATEAGFGEQLERVFADDRTRDTLWQFWSEWLRFEKFTGFETTRPGFIALADGLPIGEPGHDFYGDMVQEVQALTELYTFERQAPLADLLSTTESVTQSSDLAQLYDVEPWSGRGDYPTFESGTRAGLLQRAALLVSNLETTNPFHRGAFVRRNLLCDPLAQPDPNSLPPGSLDPPPLSANQTTRERFQAKVEGNATCASCHGQFSHIGFVLESFDALGRYRTTERVFDEENGDLIAELPIDTAGEPHIVASDESEVDGAAELNARIVESEKVERCLASKYFGFALHRLPVAQTLDDCAVADLAAALKDPQAGLAQAFMRIARQSSFFQRKVGPP